MSAVEIEAIGKFIVMPVCVFVIIGLIVWSANK